MDYKRRASKGRESDCPEVKLIAAFAFLSCIAVALSPNIASAQENQGVRRKIGSYYNPAQERLQER